MFASCVLCKGSTAIKFIILLNMVSIGNYMRAPNIALVSNNIC